MVHVCFQTPKWNEPSHGTLWNVEAIFCTLTQPSAHLDPRPIKPKPHTHRSERKKNPSPVDDDDVAIDVPDETAVVVKHTRRRSTCGHHQDRYPPYKRVDTYIFVAISAYRCWLPGFADETAHIQRWFLPNPPNGSGTAGEEAAKVAWRRLRLARRVCVDVVEDECSEECPVSVRSSSTHAIAGSQSFGCLVFLATRRVGELAHRKGIC